MGDVGARHQRALGCAANQGVLARHRHHPHAGSLAGPTSRRSRHHAHRRVRVSAAGSRDDVGGVCRRDRTVRWPDSVECARQRARARWAPGDRRRDRSRRRPIPPASLQRHLQHAPEASGGVPRAISTGRRSAVGTGPQVPRFSDRRPDHRPARRVPRQLDLHSRCQRQRRAHSELQELESGHGAGRVEDLSGPRVLLHRRGQYPVAVR